LQYNTGITLYFATLLLFWMYFYAGAGELVRIETALTLHFGLSRTIGQGDASQYGCRGFLDGCDKQTGRSSLCLTVDRLGKFDFA
jgi:hypothetical protein